MEDLRNDILLDELLGGETLKLEYKEDHNLKEDKIIEACVGMANQAGGKILVGVTDDGVVKGSFKLKSGEWTNEESIEGLILAKTTPSLVTEVTIVDHQDLKVVVIDIQKPSSVIGTKKGQYIKRRYNSKGRPENYAMNTDEIARATSKIGVNDFSSTSLRNLNLSDIDFELLSTTLKSLLKSSKFENEIEVFSKEPIDFLKTASLVSKEEVPSIACLLLFGKRSSLAKRLPNNYVQFQVFNNRGQVLKNDYYTDPIADLFPRLLQIPELNKNSDEFVLNGRSIAIAEYSQEALREAIANSLVHRDYTIGTGIQIQLLEDELIITNPGGLPEGVSINNLLSTSPTPRNRALNNAMRIMKFVESSGRGIDFIFKGQAFYGRPAPDYTATTETSVSVRLTGGKANLDFCKFILSTVSEPTVHEVLILNGLFLQRDLSLAEIAKLIQKPEFWAKKFINDLLVKGIIQPVPRVTERYMLKGSLNRFAQKAVKPTRMTKNQIKQYSQSILEILKRKGEMFKDEIADYSGLSPDQTYRLLKKLRENDQVGYDPDRKNWHLKEKHN